MQIPEWTGKAGFHPPGKITSPQIKGEGINMEGKFLCGGKCSESQMVKQNYGACATGAKMAA